MSRHDELFEAVRRDPDDETAWAVLQDWLLAHDDPRGRLATLPEAELAAELAALLPQWFGRPVQPAPETGWRVRRHLEVAGVAVRFIGDDGDEFGPSVDLAFQRGHVRRLAVDTQWNGQRPDWGQGWTCPLLGKILSHPVGQLVTDLEIRATPWSDFYYEGLVEAVTAHGLPAVRRVYCGDDDQLSWTNVPDVSSLWAAAPRLEEVTLEGSNIRLGDLDHPNLRKLHLLSGGLPKEPVRALVRASVPALEDLDVWFGDPEYGAECEMDDIRTLLQHDFPALVRMGLSNCEHGDAIATELPDAVWLPRIRALSLHGSILTDAGGEALLRAADRLQHLERLVLTECFLTEAMVARLGEAFGPRVDAGDQRDADEYGDDEPYYYVSVGE